MSIIYELNRKPKKKTASHGGVIILHTRSEDLLTGNVFGILKNLDWRFGLKPFLESVTGNKYSMSEFEGPEFHFWNRVKIYREGEGSTEVDLIIKIESTLFFIETKYGAEASSRTTNEKDRDQLKRNIDLGRSFVKDLNQDNFHLIYITTHSSIPEIAKNYKDEIDFSWTNWGSIAKTLQDSLPYFSEPEKRLAGDLIDYLAYKGFHNQPYSQPEERMRIGEKTRFESTISRLTEKEKNVLWKILRAHNLDLLRGTHKFYWGEGFSFKTCNPEKTIFRFFIKTKFKPIDLKIKHFSSLEEYLNYVQKR